MAVETGALFRITATTGGQQQVDRLAESVRRIGAAGEVSAAQTAAAFRTLPAQFTDIATQLAGGQNPFLILLQQGGQIKDQFGGIGPTFRALASTLTPVRLAVGGLAGAVLGLGAAYVAGQNDIDEFNKKLALTGNLAGVNYDRFQQLAARVSASAGGSIGTNKELLMGAIGSGAFGQQSLEPVVTAMARYKEMSGQTADAVVKDFAAMANGVAQWAAAHNRALGYLTVEQFRYIQQLERQGRTEEAVALNSRLLNEELEKRKPTLGWMERGWKAVGEAMGWVVDKMKDVGRNDPSKTAAEEIASLQKSLAAADQMRAMAAARGQNVPSESPELQAARQRLADLLQAQREEKRLLDKQAELQAQRRKQVEEEASGLNERKAQATLAARLSARQTAIQEELRQLEFERKVVDSYHQRNELSDSDYVRRITEIKQKEIDARRRLAEEKVRTEQGQPTKDAAQEIDKARKIAEAKAEVARLEKESATEAKKAGLDIEVIEDRKSKALRYYTEDLRFQNEMLKLEAQQVNMTDFEYRQLVESKQREQDIRVRARSMVADEAAGYREAAEAAGLLTAQIKQANYEKSRTFETGVRNGLKRIQDDITNVAKTTEDALVRGFNSAADALAEFVVTGKANFGDFARSVLKDLAAMIIKQTMFNVLSAGLKFLGFGSTSMAGANYSLGSGSSGLGLKMPSFAGGGYTGSGSRSGGMDGRGGFLAMLHPQESVMDHAAGQGGGGGVVVNVTVNAETGAATTDDSGRFGQLGNLIGAAVRQELITQKRPGGLLAA